MRHIGKLKNTGQRVAVLFMQLPEDRQNALIVAIDNMPDRLEQALMHELESKEGQAEPIFANVLARRLLPDMGNMSILTALHVRGLISKAPITNVIMLPEPNMPFPLEQILKEIARQNGEDEPVFEAPQSQPEISNATNNRFNQHEANLNADVSENNKGLAKSKLFEAQLLEAEAAKKREEAYSYDPSLRPVLKASAPEVPLVKQTKAPAKTRAKKSTETIIEAVEVKTVPVNKRKKTKQTDA